MPFPALLSARVQVTGPVSAIADIVGPICADSAVYAQPNDDLLHSLTSDYTCSGEPRPEPSPTDIRDPERLPASGQLRRAACPTGTASCPLAVRCLLLLDYSVRDCRPEGRLAGRGAGRLARDGAAQGGCRGRAREKKHNTDLTSPLRPVYPIRLSTGNKGTHTLARWPAKGTASDPEGGLTHKGGPSCRGP